MLLIIFSALAWLILPHAARSAVAALAMAYGIVLAIRVRNTERKILAFAAVSEHSLADFNRKPTLSHRRAIRISLKLALHQAEFRSLFPVIAEQAQHFVRGCL